MRIAAGLAALLHAGATAEPAPQTEADAYTRYELLDPAGHKFRILYEVTATTPGATAYFNPIRPGSVATDEHVLDRATGRPLAFAEVDGTVARAGGVRGAEPGQRYIRVRLARPVPTDGGEGRVLIDKTYEDAKSYFREGNTIVFDRSLGIKRNAVVLPAGYELTSLNVPAQVLPEPDGRVKIAFWNNGPAPAPLVIRARPSRSRPATSAVGELDERARQTREIVYYLEEPATHRFALTHDYTETKAGSDRYVNVVRAGSTVSAPSARNLDTGAALAVETVRGEAVRRADPAARDVTADTVAVVFRYPPLKAGETARLRIAETYTDPVRYRLAGDELVWRRTLRRPANAVVLPAGWRLTASSAPATVSLMPDGRTRLDFVNPRLDEVETIVTARRR